MLDPQKAADAAWLAISAFSAGELPQGPMSSSSELVKSILSSPDVVADVRLGCATVSFHPLPVSLDIHEEDYQVVNFIALAIQGIAAKFEGLQDPGQSCRLFQGYTIDNFDG